MTKKIKVGDTISLKPGTTSYNHFSGYMPVHGTVIEYDIHHKVGHFSRPFQVRFTDDRTAWYSITEIVLWRGPLPGEGPLTSGGYPA